MYVSKANVYALQANVYVSHVSMWKYVSHVSMWKHACVHASSPHLLEVKSQNECNRLDSAHVRTCIQLCTCC